VHAKQKEMWIKIKQEFFFLWCLNNAPPQKNALSTITIQNEQKDKPLGLEIAQYFPFCQWYQRIAPLPCPLSQKDYPNSR